MVSFLNDTAVAMIRCPEHLEQRWLGLRASDNDAFSFLTAERLEDEPWRECLDRELAWTLGLRRGRDYLIANMARRHVEITTDFDHLESPHQATVTFLVVDPYGRAGRDAFKAIPHARWISNAELRTGATTDGSPIAAWLTTILRQNDLLPHA